MLMDNSPPANQRTYDAWFRAKVEEALHDSRPPQSNEEIEAHFAARRAAARRKLED